MTMSHADAAALPVVDVARRAKSIGAQVNTLPMLGPSVGLLLLFSLVPLAATIYFSLIRYNLLNPAIHGFAGFRNYYYLLRDGTLYHSLLISVVMVVEILVITIASAAVLASLFQKQFAGRAIARVLMISPFFVMPTVSALIWKNLFMHPVNGLIAWITRSLGLGVVDFFADWPVSSVVLIASWQWMPFAFLIMLTALQSLDEETREAADLDGAGPIAVFFFVEVPHMGRAIAVVTMMETIFLLSIFAEIYVTTSGGPGDATTNLTFLIYERALLDFNVGGASAAGVIAIILANILASFMVRIVGKGLDV
jgi:sorbitol/mannitol transport system permease protein